MLPSRYRKHLPVHKLRTNVRKLDLSSPRTYHLPDWQRLSHPERLGVIRQIALARGRDPRIARLTAKILRANNVPTRDYAKQAAALLRWVQNPKNIYYVNEAGERLQDPLYTLKAKHADCDDIVLLLAAFFTSIDLSWRLVLSGKQQTGIDQNGKPVYKKIRYIEGTKPVPQANWAHIYLMVGTPPKEPKTWYFCEPTVEGVPLGWDIIDGDKRYIPDRLRKSYVGPPRLMPAPPPPIGFRPKPLPPIGRRSPAYEEAYSGFAEFNPAALVPVAPPPPSTASYSSRSAGMAGGMASTAMVMDESRGLTVNWKQIGEAIFTGVLVSVGTSLLLDYINGAGMWGGSGSVLKRWLGRNTKPSLPDTALSPLTNSILMGTDNE